MDINQNLQFHTHNGTDSPKISGNDVTFTPQTAITPTVGGTLTSGGAAVLSNADNIILVNMQTRIDDLESKLQTLGVIL